MKATVTINNITLEIDEREEMDTLHKAIVLGHPPSYCDECRESTRTYLTSNKDREGNTYVNVKCSKCGATAKLGLYKAGGYFWHRFEKYIPKPKVEQSP